MSSSDAIGGSRPIGFRPLDYPQTEKIDAHFTQVDACETRCKGYAWRRKVRNWVDLFEKKLDVGEKYLDTILPNNRMQNALDFCGKKIDDLLHPAKEFNAWLNETNKGQWYKQLSLALIKLPIKAVRNIIQMVYGIIKATAYGFVHPLKAGLHLGKLLVEMAFAFTKSETYTKIGAGAIGASLGHVAVSAGFGVHAYVGLGIGGALLLFGIATGAIEAGLTSDKPVKDVALALWDHITLIPESLLTGFLVGVIVGAIQLGIEKAIGPHKVYVHKNMTDAQAQEYVNKVYLPQHPDFPPPTSVTVVKDGIVMSWRGDDLTSLLNVPGQPQFHPPGSGILSYAMNQHPTSKIDILLQEPSKFLDINTRVAVSGSNWSQSGMWREGGIWYPTKTVPASVPLGPSCPAVSLSTVGGENR